MTRKGALNGIKSILSKNDLVFCIGNYLYKEAPEFDNEVLFFDQDYVDLISVALGVSSVIDNRVLVIIEDNYMLRYFNSILQASVSKNNNFYIFVISTRLYSNEVKQVNIYDSLKSMKGVLYNSGFLVHDYTKYLENKASVKKLEKIYSKTIGPMLSLISINNNRIYNKDIEIQRPDFNKFNEFILNSFNDSVGEDDKVYFDIDSIMKDN